MTNEQKDAWQDGYEAAQSGGSETDNPWDTANDLHLAWNDGFREGAEDREEV